MSGIHNTIARKSVAYAAGSTLKIELKSLPTSIEGLVNHLRSMTIEGSFVLTPHATLSDNGEDILGAIISEVRVYDRAGHRVFRQKGYELRDGARFYEGRDVYVDPSDVAAGGSAATFRQYAKLPIGDARYLPFLKGDDDALQPVARFTEGEARVEIDTKSADTLNATVGSGMIYVGFALEALPRLVQGVDLRFDHAEDGTPENLQLKASGLIGMAALFDSGRDFSAISAIAIPQHQIAQSSDVKAFVLAHADRMTLHGALQDPTSPDFVPLVWPTHNAGLALGTLKAAGNVLNVNVTKSSGSVYASYCEIKPMKDLLRAMLPFYSATHTIVGGEGIEAANKVPVGASAEKLRDFGPRRFPVARG